MQLHPPAISQNGHFTAIAEALTRKSTVVFSDTSVLFWLFSLGKPARQEFMDWAGTTVSDRFKIPVWAAHEIHKHMVESPGKLTPLQGEIRSVQGKIRELSRVVSLFADDRKREGLLDRREYIASLERKAEEFIKLCKAAGQQPDWHKLSADIVPFINRHVLSSDIFPSLRWAEADYSTRVSGRVPPGYKDNKKNENKFGDLVFWKEIIDYCSSNKTYSTAVLITDDNKPDWVFKPQSVLDEAGVSHKNDSEEGYETLLAPPLLTHEIGLHSNIRRFYMVNTTILAVVLERYSNRAIPALFAAVQPVIPKARPDFTDLSAAAEKKKSEGSLPAEQKPAVLTAEIIKRLSSKDATEQEEALSQIEAGLLAFSVSELQSVGKAISKATRTELQNASNFIRRIDLATVGMSKEARNALYIGMLTDLYFDETGASRSLPLNGDVEGIFAVSEKNDVAEALNIFKARIEPYRGKYLALPDRERKRVPVTFVLGPERRSEARELEQLLHGGNSLLEEVPIDSPDALNACVQSELKPPTIDDILVAVARRYSVPFDWLVADQPLQTPVAWDETKGFIDL